MPASKSNTAVIFTDLINSFDFNGGDDLLEHTKEILPNLKKLKQYAKDNGLPVIYVNDHYGLWQANYDKIIDLCLNEKSREIIEEMTPTEDDYFLMKPQHSVFFQTPLQSLLVELECNELIFAGIAGDICILFSVENAHMFKFKTKVPKDCMASEETKNNDFALYLMESVMDTDITPINDRLK